MKHTYTAHATNNSGCSISVGIDFDNPNGGREFTSVRNAENAARGELGSGWHVTVTRDDGEIVSTFTIR